ncbi:MAG: hypothetical protein DRP26_05455 [Candidatus Zixiibacteriota bacterium]|nr:MAG: hypothetical protein DRP26_05455 [candidate division Zixibacteria bacterium]
MFSPNAIEVTIRVGPPWAPTFTTYNFEDEREAFEFAYDSANKSGEWPNWNNFWSQWKANHSDDYQAYHGLGTLKGGDDWERRFLWAAYDWGDSNVDGMPDGLNREWWEDMSYGDDRSSLTDDMATAATIDNSTGLAEDNYYFNSRYQANAWSAWLSDNGLNEKGEDKTVVEDKTQGGTYVDPGEIIGDQAAKHNKLKNKALAGGIYIGITGTSAEDVDKNGIVEMKDRGLVIDALGQEGENLEADVNGDEVVDEADVEAVDAAAGTVAYEIVDPKGNFLSSCTESTQFYNAIHPNRDSGQYAPSNVLKIDVSQVNDWVELEMPEFNGVMYVDLNGVFGDLGDENLEKTNGVMLVNGERLPDGGLSLVTPNSVYIKGNYNLDPNGDEEINRDADDADGSDIITRTIANKSYITSEGDLSWQPAEIISYRPVYTLSEDFPEPQSMPLPEYHYYQYHDENGGRTEVDIIDDPRWGSPGASWMPDYNMSFSSIINQWSSLTGITPELDKEWIEDNWGTYWSDDSVIYDFNTDDEDPDNNIYIMRRDLKQQVYDYVGSYYRSAYAYDPAKDPTEPQLANNVYDKYVYNTAIVSPYDTNTYTLEQWRSGSKRSITGAFIKLPNSYKRSIPSASYVYYYRTEDPPDKKFSYETRFGSNSVVGGGKPAAQLTFGADSSWREVTSF